MIVLLTPGQFNSAYYEHSFLADKLGVELVEGRDLFVARRHRLYAHHRKGRSASMSSIGASTTISSTRWRSIRSRCSACRACSAAYKAGNVTLANAVGTGDRRRQGDLQLCAGDHRILSWRKANPEERTDLALPRARGARLCARASSGTRRQGSQRLRRLRHVDRSARDASGNGAVRRKAARRSRTISSPSRPWRSPPARPHSTAALRRAMSICGPSCCLDPMACVWCRAA